MSELVPTEPPDDVLRLLEIFQSVMKANQKVPVAKLLLHDLGTVPLLIEFDIEFVRNFISYRHFLQCTRM